MYLQCMVMVWIDNDGRVGEVIRRDANGSGSKWNHKFSRSSSQDLVLISASSFELYKVQIRFSVLVICFE